MYADCTPGRVRALRAVMPEGRPCLHMPSQYSAEAIKTLRQFYNPAARMVQSIRQDGEYYYVRMSFGQQQNGFHHLDHVPTEIIVSAALQACRCVIAHKVLEGVWAPGANSGWFERTSSNWDVAGLKLSPREEMRFVGRGEVEFCLKAKATKAAIPGYLTEILQFANPIGDGKAVLRGDIAWTFPKRTLPGKLRGDAESIQRPHRSRIISREESQGPVSKFIADIIDQGLGDIYRLAAYLINSIHQRKGGYDTRLSFDGQTSGFLNHKFVPIELLVAAAIQSCRCAMAYDSYNGSLCDGANTEWFKRTSSNWRLISLEMKGKQKVGFDAQNPSELHVEVLPMFQHEKLPKMVVECRFSGAIEGKTISHFPLDEMPNYTAILPFHGRQEFFGLAHGIY